MPQVTGMKQLQQGFVRMNNINKEYRKHIPEIIQSYIGNLSEITAIDTKYFIDILNRIDYIKFSIDDEQIIDGIEAITDKAKELKLKKILRCNL